MKRSFERVAVLMGGVSSEREVSLRSGVAIARGLRAGGYTVTEVDVIDREFELPAGIDAAFIALHGEFGEDGGVQRALAKKGVPFSGSGAESSRIAFDKILTRERLEAHGIPVPKGEVLRCASARTLSLPVVVKPPREGSSVGIHLVFDERDWEAAFSDAVQYSKDVLVEEYIPGRELTVGGVGTGDSTFQLFPAVEIKTAGDWYDFDAKYVTGDTQYVVPAQLDSETEFNLQSLALKTFQSLEAEGVGRVDFRLSPAGEPYVLELNTIPGFTETSLLPKAAQAVGVGFSELCCRIMERAHL